MTSWAFESLRLDTIGLVTKIGDEPSESVANNAGYLFCEEVTDYRPTTAVEPLTVKRWVRERT